LQTFISIFVFNVFFVFELGSRAGETDGIMETDAKKRLINKDQSNR